MIAAQPELQFDQPTTAAGVDQDRLQELLEILRASAIDETRADRAGWITRRELEQLGFDEREIRELSERDLEGRIFSYPGSPGYKLFDFVTDEEFDRCIALKHQGEKMVGKYVRYQRRWHSRFKPQQS